MAGIAASSPCGTATVVGAYKPVEKLYNPTRAVRPLAAVVVKVPPSAVPEVVPTPTVGAATYPKPALVIVKLTNCPLAPMLAVAAGKQLSGKAKVALPVMVSVGNVEYKAEPPET